MHNHNVTQLYNYCYNQLLNNFSQWSHAYQTSMKILNFQRHSANIRNSLIRQRKLLLHFLIHLKNACNIHRIFMKQSGSIPVFNIPGTLFWNFPRNFIGNFCRIYREYLMGMFHEYSTNMYLPRGGCNSIRPYINSF